MSNKKKPSPSGVDSPPVRPKSPPVRFKSSAVCPKPPAVCTKPPAPCAKSPAVCAKPPAACAKSPAVCPKPPAVCTKPPAVCPKPPAVCTKPPAVCPKPPAVCTKPPAVFPKPPPPPPLPSLPPSSCSAGLTIIDGQGSTNLGSDKNPNSKRSSTCSKEKELKEAQALKLCKQQFDNEGFHMTNKLLLSFFVTITPVLQDGPSCGLAALCMASELLKTKDGQPQKRTLEEVLTVARSHGYTNRGEMFSAKNMWLLTTMLLHCNANLVTTGLDDHSRIMKHLMRGQPILVPYDADMNHRPCCKKGHKAHWAVLTGVVLVIPSEMSHLLVGSFTQDPGFQPLQHSNACVESFDFRGCIANIFVYAWQGKSLHPALWSYTDLLISNDNLVELSPGRKNSETHYVVPKEGVKGGLCRQLLLLEDVNANKKPFTHDLKE